MTETSASGRVHIERPGKIPNIMNDFYVDGPIRVELQEGETHRNILAEKAEVVLTVQNNKLTLNLNLEGTHDVTFDQWQKGDIPD